MPAPAEAGHGGRLHVLAAAAAAGLLLRHAAFATAADADMFHEMALFREALARGALPFDDVFAYTPTVYPVVHHEWGTGAVLYLIAVAAGLGHTGLIALHWLLIAATAACVWICAVRRGGHPILLALLAGVAASLFAPGLSPVRAQLFSFLFLAIMLLILPRHERLGPRFLLLWLPIYTIWLNLHGGFVVGAGLFAVYSIERLARTFHHSRDWRHALHRHRFLLAALPAMALLVLVNPYGVHYAPYLWQALRMDRPLVAEWAPLWDPRVSAVLIAAFAASVAVALYALLRARGRNAFDGLPLLAVAALLTLQHQRLAPVYAILWFCLVPGWLAATPLHDLAERLAVRHRALVAGGALILFALGVVQAARARSWQLTIPDSPATSDFYFPVLAVRYLDDVGFHGNLMTPFDVGAYVSWMLHPRVRVSIDSRYEVAYPAALLGEHIRFYGARPGWRDILERYPTDAVLVPVDAPIDGVLRAAQEETGWREAHRDVAYSIYARPSAAPR